MTFLVKDNWRELNLETWARLEEEKVPPDVYIELLRFARTRLRIRVDEAIDAALSDPDLAKEAFFGLPEPNTEARSIELIEGYHDILQEFPDKDLARNYKDAVRQFVESRNLRYTISDNCKIHLSIPGLLVTQYSKLRNELAGNSNVAKALKQLEASLSRLPNTLDEERNCIVIAMNVLEGIACEKTSNNRDTLGAAIEGCRVFPHRALIECVKDFYKFASDYPLIRHKGHPERQLRELKKDDALLALSFAIAFGSYIFDNDSSNAILNGEL